MIILLALAAALGNTGLAPGLSRTYVCFFDRGSARVTDRCRQIVVGLARAWRVFLPAQDGAGQRALRVAVQASAPDAGGPEAGRRLSLLRALAVAGELRAAGVPDELILPVGFGDEILPYPGFLPGQPLDPQNRVALMILY